ncbi:structure-specific endonuclease subunit SLX1 homolog isoform X2 [Maniola jurtina]|nr:structure-specific endonuclease subunit SLX1 homolog isoform X2 [Maniola jurtina]
MVMIVHGFPNNISALRFEWAWQNPNKTTRLQHLDLKKIPRKETEYQFKLRVLSEMLRVGPWCRLPLMIRWLENEYREEFPPERKPPDHMTVIQGPVKSYNHKKTKDITSVPTIECLLCSSYLKDTEKLSCTNATCDLVSHINCLANLFLPPGEYIPINGYCPFCNTKLKWGDLIRKMNGYDQGIKNDEPGEDDDNDEVSTEDRGFDNFDDIDDVVCTQDNFDNDDVICTQNFDDVACTQDGVFVDDLEEDDDVICTQDQFNNVDDVVCTKDRVFHNFDTGENDDVICTLDAYKTDDKNDKYDDSDDEVLFKRDKVYDDQPSWFLDCNENL